MAYYVHKCRHKRRSPIQQFSSKDIWSLVMRNQNHNIYDQFVRLRVIHLDSYNQNLVSIIFNMNE